MKRAIVILGYVENEQGEILRFLFPPSFLFECSFRTDREKVFICSSFLRFYLSVLLISFIVFPCGNYMLLCKASAEPFLPLVF